MRTASFCLLVGLTIYVMLGNRPLRAVEKVGRVMHVSSICMHCSACLQLAIAESSRPVHAGSMHVGSVNAILEAFVRKRYRHAGPMHLGFVNTVLKAFLIRRFRLAVSPKGVVCWVNAAGKTAHDQEARGLLGG